MNFKLDTNKYDGLIFTSKNAVMALNSLTNNWKRLPSYVIGPKTAYLIKKLGGRVRFISDNHYGDSFSKELVDILRGKQVLYLRGDKVALDIRKRLSAWEIVCDEAILYEAQCIEGEEKNIFPKESIIIFTSPFIVKCFFKKNIWDSSYLAVAIGETTAKAFPHSIQPISVIYYFSNLMYQ